MKTEQNFINQINNNFGYNGASKILKAYEFASEKHKGQKRESGEEFILHPIAVANILLEYKADENTIISGLLHDCLEQTNTSEKEIYDVFGSEVKEILVGLAKIEDIKRAYVLHGEEAENLRKMLLALGSDARIALVKLAERLHNMQTLQYKNAEKQVKIAKETLDLYVPLAERLGMSIFKRQMEDLCFKYLFPEDYVNVNNYLDEYYQKSEDVVSDIVKSIKALCEEHKIEARVQSRKKSSFGVFKKQQEKGKNKVFDIIAHRIITTKVQDCYTMLGAVHDKWKPLDGRIKDYIAHPKPNLYMSLHTTVLYPSSSGDIPFEIQIRTEEMHNYCEYGIAAHWVYKESGVKALSHKVSEATLRKNLTKDSEKILSNENSNELIDTISQGFYSDKIFVFSPTMNVIELPKDSITIDFAYSIHSNLGNKCVGARVNGKMVPLTTKLKTGDLVEIITSSNAKGPSRDWLKIVKSKQALNKIRAYFKKEKREENVKIGKDILEESAKRNGYTLSKLFEDKETLVDILEKHRLATVEDLFASVGYGGISSNQITSKFLSKLKLIEKQEKTYTQKASKTNDSVLIGGHSDLLKKFAKCCNPIPGDDIVGYVSRGKGVTVHRKDCEHLKTLEQDRIINTEWSSISDDGLYDATIKIIVKNSVGVLSVVSGKIAESKIDINYISTDKTKNTEDVVLSVGVKIKSRKQLVEMINKLRAMNEVYDVYR